MGHSCFAMSVLFRQCIIGGFAGNHLWDGKFDQKPPPGNEKLYAPPPQEKSAKKSVMAAKMGVIADKMVVMAAKNGRRQPYFSLI